MADVDFSFSGDASSLQRALEEIKVEIKKTKESVSSLATGFTAVYMAAQGAIQAIKATFSAVSNIPGQAARMEDLVTVFTTLMGSAEDAATLISDLWHDAANGAVGLEEMAAAAKPLVNVFSNTATIREWSRRFADISTGSGVAADALAKVYARVLTLGHVDSKSVDSLAKQGIPIYQELSKVIGVSAEEVRRLAKQGALTAEQYTAALRAMTDAGGQFYNQSSQLSSTAAGSWSTMLENINRVAAALGTPINAAVTPVIQEIATALENAIPQVELFAKELVEGFQGIVGLISPIVSAIGSLVSVLGGAKTVFASVAAAMLMYIGNGKAAAATTVSLRAQIGSLATSIKGLSLVSFTSAFKSAFMTIKGVFASTLMSMRIVWTATWATMAAVVRTAMVAVKAAIISTGIGLLIVAIGEALGALYNWFMGNSEAAKEAAESAREFERSLKNLEKQAGKVKTQEQMDSFMEGIDERIDELKGQMDDADADDDVEKMAQLQDQIAALEKKKAMYEETLPLQIEEARRAAQVAERLKQQREEAEALNKKLAEARDKIADLAKKQREQSREKFLSGLDTDAQVKLRLSDVGMSSMEELAEALHKLESSEFISLGDDEQYTRLLATFNKITELQEKQREKEKEKTKAAAEANAAYENQVGVLQAQVDGNARLEQQLRDQQRIVQLTEEYRRQGLADAEARARRIVELESRKTRDKAQTDYNQQIALLQAQITGDERRLRLVKAQQRIVQLTEQYRSQGLTNAEAKAKRVVAMEQQAEEAAKAAAKATEHGQRISDSMAQVGGGGRSVVIGGPMLSESKKHTALLIEVGNQLKKPQTVKLSGNLKAVLGR